MKRLILTLLLGLATAFAVWYGLNPLLKNQEPDPSEIPTIAAGTVFSAAQPIAHFSLTDTAQKSFTQQDLVGQWTILFFGYAHCPEVCPKALAVASDFWKKLPEEVTSKKIRFAFITLNPKEDTVEDLKTFLGRFNPQFIGLTGDISEINKLSKSCRVYSWEDPNVKTPQGKKMIDHTAAFILINPEGRMQALFSPPHNGEEIAKDLSVLLESRSGY